MILYHGGTEIVAKPRILESARLLDFGKGFYTTTNRDQAARWAQKVAVRRKLSEKYISIYALDAEAAERELTILHFDRPDAEWLDFVSACRSGRQRADLEYDIVFGPVADDNVYAAIQLYELGILDKAETLKRLKVESLYDQILFHTARALTYCSFTGAEAL